MYFTLSKKLVKENFSEIMSGLESEMSIFNSSDYIDDNIDEIAAMEDIANLGEAITSFGIDVIGLEADTESGASEEKKKGRLAKIGAWLKEIWSKLVNYIKLFFNSYARKMVKIKKYLKELDEAVKAGLDVKDYGDAKVDYSMFLPVYLKNDGTGTPIEDQDNASNSSTYITRADYIQRLANYVSKGCTLSLYKIKNDKNIDPADSIIESIALIVSLVNCANVASPDSVAGKRTTRDTIIEDVKKLYDSIHNQEENGLEEFKNKLNGLFTESISFIKDAADNGLARNLDDIRVKEVKDSKPSEALQYYNKFNSTLEKDFFANINEDTVSIVRTKLQLDGYADEMKNYPDEKKTFLIKFSKDFLLYNKETLTKFNANYKNAAKVVFSFINQVYKTEMKTLKEIEKLIKK